MEAGDGTPIAAKLQQVIQSMGISKSAFGAILGVGSSTVTDLTGDTERLSLPGYYLRLLEVRLGVQPAWIVGDSDQPFLPDSEYLRLDCPDSEKDWLLYAYDHLIELMERKRKGLKAGAKMHETADLIAATGSANSYQALKQAVGQLQKMRSKIDAIPLEQFQTNSVSRSTMYQTLHKFQRSFLWHIKNDYESRPLNLWQQNLELVRRWLAVFIELNIYDYVETHKQAIDIRIALAIILSGMKPPPYLLTILAYEYNLNPDWLRGNSEQKLLGGQVQSTYATAKSQKSTRQSSLLAGVPFGSRENSAELDDQKLLLGLAQSQLTDVASRYYNEAGIDHLGDSIEALLSPDEQKLLRKGNIKPDFEFRLLQKGSELGNQLALSSGFQLLDDIKFDLALESPVLNRELFLLLLVHIQLEPELNVAQLAARVLRAQVLSKLQSNTIVRPLVLAPAFSSEAEEQAMNYNIDLVAYQDWRLEFI